MFIAFHWLLYPACSLATMDCLTDGCRNYLRCLWPDRMVGEPPSDCTYPEYSVSDMKFHGNSILEAVLTPGHITGSSKSSPINGFVEANLRISISRELTTRIQINKYSRNSSRRRFPQHETLEFTPLDERIHGYEGPPRVSIRCFHFGGDLRIDVNTSNFSLEIFYKNNLYYSVGRRGSLFISEQGLGFPGPHRHRDRHTVGIDFTLYGVVDVSGIGPRSAVSASMMVGRTEVARKNNFTPSDETALPNSLKVIEISSTAPGSRSRYLLDSELAGSIPSVSGSHLVNGESYAFSHLTWLNPSRTFFGDISERGDTFREDSINYTGFFLGETGSVDLLAILPNSRRNNLLQVFHRHFGLPVMPPLAGLGVHYHRDEYSRLSASEILDLNSKSANSEIPVDMIWLQSTSVIDYCDFSPDPNFTSDPQDLRWKLEETKRMLLHPLHGFFSERCTSKRKPKHRTGPFDSVQSLPISPAGPILIRVLHPKINGETAAPITLSSQSPGEANEDLLISMDDDTASFINDMRDELYGFRHSDYIEDFSGSQLEHQYNTGTELEDESRSREGIHVPQNLKLEASHFSADLNGFVETFRHQRGVYDLIFPDFSQTETLEWWENFFQKRSHFDGMYVWFPVTTSLHPTSDKRYHPFKGNNGPIPDPCHDLPSDLLFVDSVENSRYYLLGEVRNICWFRIVKATYSAMVNKRFDFHRIADVYDTEFYAPDHDGDPINILERRRPLLVTSSFYPGSHKYSAINYTGLGGTWDGLKAIIQLTSDFVSVGGVSFFGINPSSLLMSNDEELIVRWYQLTSLVNMLFIIGPTGDYKDTWDFSDDTREPIKDAIHLRYEYLPYIYTLFYFYSTNGSPVISHPTYELGGCELIADKGVDIEETDWTTVKHSGTREQQILLGSSILVVPVVDKGLTEMSVQLPVCKHKPDLLWYDSHRNVFSGSPVVRINIDIRSLPLFFLGGSIITRQPNIRRSVSLKKGDAFSIDVYPDSTGDAVGWIYLDNGDDGLALDHRRYSLIRLEWRTSSCNLRSIVLNQGGFVYNISDISWPLSSSPKQSTFFSENNFIERGRRVILRKPGVTIGQSWELILGL